MRQTHGATLFKVLDVLPGLFARVDRVDGRDGPVGVVEPFAEALDGVKVDLEAGSDDEEVVPGRKKKETSAQGLPSSKPGKRGKKAPDLRERISRLTYLRVELSAVETVFCSGWNEVTAVSYRLTPPGMTSCMGFCILLRGWRPVPLFSGVRLALEVSPACDFRMGHMSCWRYVHKGPSWLVCNGKESR